QGSGQRHKTLSVLKELAKVLHENRQIEQRDAVYKRILDLEPDDSEAQQALGMSKRGGRGEVSAPPKRATEYLEAVQHHEDEISAEIDEEALRAQHMQEEAIAGAPLAEESSGVDLLEDA